MENNIYYKLSEQDRATLNKVSEATMTIYGIEQDFIPIGNLFVALEDLLTEYHYLEERANDLQHELDERPLPPDEDDYIKNGVSEHDFY